MSTPDPPSFTCPCCGIVSYNRNDVAQRFCGRCHAWTGDPALAARHLARHCPHRPFTPDWTLHPGVVLRAVIRHRGIGEADLADRARLGPESVAGILGGMMAVDGFTAQRLEEALGTPGAQFWMDWQAGYEADLARGATDSSKVDICMTDGPAPHTYVSTACFHGECGACRNTCKYCDAPCSHSCHPGPGQGAPEPWVDQARGMAVLLLGALGPDGVPDGLRQRIAADPALFWLRGEAKPPGEWREPKTTEDPARE